MNEQLYEKCADAEQHQSPSADSRGIHGAGVAFYTFHTADFLPKINKPIRKPDRIPHQCSRVFLQLRVKSWLFYLR